MTKFFRISALALLIAVSAGAAAQAAVWSTSDAATPTDQFHYEVQTGR
jgi:hypothetical protein